MEQLEIVTYPDKLLILPSREVKNIDGTIQQLIKNMTEIMYTSQGIGLAAVQVGFNKNIIIYDISPMDGKSSLNILVNPRVVYKEGKTISENEGCLSLPDFRANVKRAAKVVVEGLDKDGNPMEIEAEGLSAVVLQHEIDHLDGILFIDRISSLKRNLYKNRIKKKLKNQ